MKLIVAVLLSILLSACATSDVNYYDFPVKTADQVTIANDLAWHIKERHGANAVFNFNYPMWSTSTPFSEHIETALRRLGIGVYVSEIPQGKHNELYYTLSKLNDQQFYIRVVVNDQLSFQRIWIYQDEQLFPLPTTTVFEGVSHRD
ncbi:hypothetical protein [Shewanella khirikhana]|uniref:Conjugal transfer protein TrbH n=1 Tax=Shewanella khirikhana TaxID=1965282 RepID=A0ABM7DXM6_9GAMM|nr:hypothetical protein [Shewanella khirikhana]AZQ13327.1 hypothetical protein STH12_04301 [Shewanella khirikhana]